MKAANGVGVTYTHGYKADQASSIISKREEDSALPFGVTDTHYYFGKCCESGVWEEVAEGLRLPIWSEPWLVFWWFHFFLNVLGSRLHWGESTCPQRIKNICFLLSGFFHLRLIFYFILFEKKSQILHQDSQWKDSLIMRLMYFFFFFLAFWCLSDIRQLLGADALLQTLFEVLSQQGQRYLCR